MLRRLDSNAQAGLDAAEVARRLAQYGRNKLPEGRKQGPFMRFLLQLHNILVYVLLGAGFVKLMVGLWLDAAIILGVVLLNALLGLTLWAFFWAKSYGVSDELARSVAVNALVIGQIFYLLNSRYKLDSSLSLRAYLGNWYLPLGIIAVVILQLLFTYTPPLQALFETADIPFRVWPWLVLGGLVFFLIVEAEKMIIRRRRTAPGSPTMAAPVPA